jgi:hypothetical protein
VLPVALALTRLWRFARRRERPGLADLAWVVPGAVYLLLQVIQRLTVHGQAGGVADASANLTWPFKALVPGVYRDVARTSWTVLGRYDYNLLEFVVLASIVVAACLVLRSTTAPAHERLAFLGFVGLEMVIASGQFWDTVFGDGRTYIDCFLLAVILLLATPATRVTATASTTAEAAADGARKVWVTAANRVFTTNRVVTNKQLGWLAAVAIAVLIVVARRRILFE